MLLMIGLEVQGHNIISVHSYNTEMPKKFHFGFPEEPFSEHFLEEPFPLALFFCPMETLKNHSKVPQMLNNLHGTINGSTNPLFLRACEHVRGMVFAWHLVSQ